QAMETRRRLNRRKVAQARRAKGFTQAMLAEQLHMGERSYQRFETEGKPIPENDLKILSKILEIPAEQLCLDEEPYVPTEAETALSKQSISPSSPRKSFEEAKHPPLSSQPVTNRTKALGWLDKEYTDRRALDEMLLKGRPPLPLRFHESFDLAHPS